MSVLEFISSIKWPIVALVALAVVARGSKKHPGWREWIKKYIEGRDISGRAGPFELQTSTPGGQAIVQAAASSDEQVAQAAREALTATPDGTSGGAPVDVAALRRDLVEEVIRNAAQWGWEMAGMGFRSPPVPYVRWSAEGEPEIRFGASAEVSASDRLLRALANAPDRHLSAHELRQRAIAQRLMLQAEEALEREE